MHPAAFAADLAVQQRDQDALRQESAGHDVGDGDADAQRALAGKSRHRHDAGHALRDLVDRGTLGIGTILAEAGNAAIDDPRIALSDRLEIDAEPSCDARAHVLDDDVGLFGKPHEDLAALVGLQVERDGALVAMQVLEVRTVAPADHLAGFAALGGGSTRITSAPQSASVRTQDGPARARVRSRTLNRDSGSRGDWVCGAAWLEASTGLCMMSSGLRGREIVIQSVVMNGSNFARSNAGRAWILAHQSATRGCFPAVTSSGAISSSIRLTNGTAAISAIE